MKYSADIDPGSDNTSHGIVIDLVGSGKRVLDVGCATGYMAEVLTGRGNRVSGVEIDAEAAEQARRHLERLVVGDLESLDLVAEFGEGSFDVVVYADVLEHLKDPLAVLRQARALLSPGGYVVVSIPNVAHGSVRLALVQGRFEYQELGLLDDTHLRFFTRSSVMELLGDAGFVPTDMRQTVAPPFGTEISLSPDDFSPELVARIEEDPEATTYQFVVKAAPLGAGAGDDTALVALAERDQEARQLRLQLAAIARNLAGTPQQPVLGIIDCHDPSDPAGFSDVRVAVAIAELRRRLDGFAFRVYGLAETSSPTALGGELARALLPWDRALAAKLAADLDALVVVTGPRPPTILQAIVDDVGDAGCPVHFVVAEAPDAGRAPPDWLTTRLGQGVYKRIGTATPVFDLLGMAGRLFGEGFLLQRADQLRMLGLLPDSKEFTLVHVTGLGEAMSGTRIGRAVEAIARRSATELLVVEPVGVGRPHGSAEDRVLPDTPPLDWSDAPVDLLATLSAADLVITDSPATLAMAIGLGRPVLGITDPESDNAPTLAGWGETDGLIATGPDELVALAGTARPLGDDGALLDRLIANLELFLDGFADAVLPEVGRRLVQTVPVLMAELADQIAVLETVNASLRQSLVRERHVFAAQAHALRHQLGQDTVLDSERGERRRARAELEEAHREIERLQKEIEYIYATRTMRAVQPARRLYGRLRSIAR